MSKKANYFSIGIFVIVGFVLGAACFVYFGAAKLYRNTEDVLVTFTDSTHGLRLGAKVKAYGVEIGKVKRIMLHRKKGTEEIVIPVLLEIDLDHVSTLMGYRNYKAFSISDRFKDLDIEAYATLQTESVLTGLLYVEIVFGQGSEGFVLESDRFAEYESIPTQPTDMDIMLQSLQDVGHNISQIDFAKLADEVSMTMQDFRNKMDQLDIEALEASINELLNHTEDLVTNPELGKVISEMASLIHNLNSITTVFDEHAEDTFLQIKNTLSEMETIAQEAKNWVSPSSAIYQEAVVALDQIGDASRSLRILVEYLERNPNALLTGKSIETSKP